MEKLVSVPMIAGSHLLWAGPLSLLPYGRHAILLHILYIKDAWTRVRSLSRRTHIPWSRGDGRPRNPDRRDGTASGEPLSVLPRRSHAPFPRPPWPNVRVASVKRKLARFLVAISTIPPRPCRYSAL